MQDAFQAVIARLCDQELTPFLQAQCGLIAGVPQAVQGRLSFAFRARELGFRYGHATCVSVVPVAGAHLHALQHVDDVQPVDWASEGLGLDGLVASVDDSASSAAAETSAETSTTRRKVPRKKHNDAPELAHEWLDAIIAHVNSLPRDALPEAVQRCVMSSSKSGFLNVSFDLDFLEQLAPGCTGTTTEAPVTAPPPALVGHTFADNAPPELQMMVRAVGFIESVYGQKHGTPRQAALAPHSRARLQLLPDIPPATLEGLDGFSHVWLVFVFHKNDNPTDHLRSKVRPPRLGTRTGLFSTRSPHRVNDFGLSVVKLDSVEGDTLHFSGIDLVDGTPVLDIKPYHPADCVPHATVPAWVEIPEEAPLRVLFTERAEAQIVEFAPKMRLYNDPNEVQLLITESLQQDPRTRQSKRKHHNGVYAISLDRLDVVFQYYEEQSTVLVIKVEWYAEDEERPQQLRTKEWLERISGEIQAMREAGELNVGDLS